MKLWENLVEIPKEETFISGDITETRGLKDAYQVCKNLINLVPSQGEKGPTVLLIINMFQ